MASTIDDDPVADIEDNLNEYVHLSGMVSENRIFENERVLMASIPLGVPTMNIALLKREDDLENVVPKIAAFFQEKGMPYSVWSRRTGEEGIAKRMDACGLKPYFKVPGMTLEKGRARFGAPVAEGVRVVKVSGNEGMLRFAKAAFEGNEMPEETWPGFVTLIQQLDPRVRTSNVALVAERGSEPIATALLFLGSSTAGVYWISTTPTERKKGIGRKVTQEALRLAFSVGYSRIILQSSPMAASLYSSMGFEQRCVFEIFGP